MGKVDGREMHSRQWRLPLGLAMATSGDGNNECVIAHKRHMMQSSCE